MRISIKFFLALLVLITLSFFHLFAGSIEISFSEMWQALTNYDANQTNHIIVRDLRIPRLAIAIIAGAGLSISGLLLQTLFKNPLAEPNILGVSTGSSLFVALTILSGITFFHTEWGIIASALLGAFIVGILLLFFVRFIKYQNSLLLIGIMIGSFAVSFISVLQAYSEVNQLKSFMMWSMGSLQQVTFDQLPFISILFLIGVALCFFQIRSLNAFTLGEENAALLGINIKRIRILLIIITSILTGLITAFCGPIAFIGMAVPNLVRIIFKTQNHLYLIIGNLLFGAIFLLLCDTLVQIVSDHILLPINAVTSMIGAPFVIYIIIKRWS